MEQIALNNALILSFPDGFRKLNDAELNQWRAAQSGASACFRDDDRHIIVSLGFRKEGLLSGLLNGNDLIKPAQRRMAWVMRAYGYQWLKEDTRLVGGKEARCFQYTYTAQGISMLGECCAIREGKILYYLHCYVRREYEEPGLQTWKDVLAKARWKKR